MAGENFEICPSQMAENGPIIIHHGSTNSEFGKVLALFGSWQGFSKAVFLGKVWQGLARLARSGGHPV